MLGNPRFEIVRVDLVMVSMYKLAPFGSEFFFWSNIDYFELFHFPVLPAPPCFFEERNSPGVGSGSTVSKHSDHERILERSTNYFP
jgi:hypothetical protein